MKRLTTILTIVSILLILASAQPSQSQTPGFSVQSASSAAQLGKGSPEFRAIAGVSMGGYGAMNTGLSHPNAFQTVACLGGPLDMAYLLKYIEVNLVGCAHFDQTNTENDHCCSGRNEL